MVGNAWETLTGERAGSVRMQPYIVATQTKPMECAMGAVVKPEINFADEQQFDALIVTDLWIWPGFNPTGQWREATSWVRDQYQRGALVTSVCTGSLLLAEAGLLDGLEATTHWGSTEMFRRYYPNVVLKPEKVLSLTGEEQRVITAGGASSWAELALYLITRFCGAEEAARSAKVFLLGDRSEGQLPFASMARPKNHEDAIIDKCQCWIAEHYDQRNPVAQMVNAIEVGKFDPSLPLAFSLARLFGQRIEDIFDPEKDFASEA